MKARVQNLEWIKADCCKAHELFDCRTPGLFKIEFFDNQMLSLAPKSYFSEKEPIQGVENDANQMTKKACKDLSTKLNQFCFDTYLNVLKTKRSRVGINKGFICKNHQVFTYTQKRAGLSFFYGKCKVLEDRITTILLDL